MLPLTVIICTLHRETEVRRTLNLLFGPQLQATESVVLRVMVVDQGRTLQRTDYPAEWNLRIVHQANLGGAGGFTRGMIEAADEGAGWVLLLDDDAMPDPDSFPVLARYIRSREPDTRFAVHGAMFSAEDPDFIYEAGATIKEPRDRSFDIVQRLRGYQPELPMTEDKKLRENMDIDYGAWWCFCIHTRTIREVGLPLPLFIRGDDAEYGLRLKNKGIPTIPLPGLRVWHPEHSGRLNRWYFLFDMRNKLIVLSLHLQPSSWGLSLTLWRRVFYRLLGAEYDLAELMIGGLDEFLAGPPALAGNPSRLVTKARRLASRGVEFTGGRSRKIRRVAKVKAHRGARRIVQTVLLNGLWLPARPQIDELPAFDHDQFDWLRVFRVPAFAVLSPEGDEMRVHRRCPRTFLRLLTRLCRLTCTLLFRYRKLKRTWCRDVVIYHCPETWRKYASVEPALDGSLTPVESAAPTYC